MTRRQWLTSLAGLVSPSFRVEATDALTSMVPALAHLPDSLFTDTTLRHVAMAKRRQSVPAFDEIVGALNLYRDRYVVSDVFRLAAPNADLPSRHMPDPAEVKAVAELLTSWRREQARRECDRIDAECRPRHADVTLKGEALERLRANRVGRMFT